MTDTEKSGALKPATVAPVKNNDPTMPTDDITPEASTNNDDSTLSPKEPSAAPLPIEVSSSLETTNEAGPSPSATDGSAIQPTDGAAAPTPAGPPPPPQRTKVETTVIMLALCSALFLVALDATIITTALPTIAADFNSTLGYTWVGSAFMLANAAVVPIWGKFSDIWGRKPVLLVATCIFFIGSLLCGVSRSMGMLIGARAIQGAGGGGIVSLVNISISDLFSLRDRGFYFGMIGLVWAVASAAGPLLGGVFTTEIGDRINVGVITGDMLVDGKPRDFSFQRKTGYVQQQDLHLETTTVREALNFSAILRQPAHVPREEKLAYVDEVIEMLDMQDYAEAVVGVPGSGLNVEQRKRLSIGVELAARPPILLFVDEPTSGLDSQTSWAILDLLEKLTNAGQAILCTIHQPSAMLFQRFDRLLFLRRGGQTVYFGDIGEHSKTLTSYFERHGAHPCPKEANPAEWMLEVIGAAPGSHTDLDWHEVWKASEECAAVKNELARLKAEPKPDDQTDATAYNEFAAPFSVQMREVLGRVFAQYWRTPSYIYSKFALCLLVAMFIGFVFYKAPKSIQGMQNQMFAIFQLFTIFGQLVQQTLPYFVIQRDLYEVRERPSKVYSWKVFMLAQICVEIPWNSLMAIVMFFCWYYPVGLYQNAAFADQTTERGALMFLYLLMFLIFTSTFADFCIAGFQTAEAGANIANLLFMLCLIFCGILASPDAFPHFWIFMYRVSPFTYLASGMLSVGLANSEVTCAANEWLTIQPPSGKTCYEYMEAYITGAGGYLKDDNATSDCQFCTIKDTNVYLASVSSHYEDRWRNFGLMFVYIFFNICAALAIYWWVRVPKKQSPLATLFGKKKAE